MRIVQLIYSLTGGGAERFTVDLANELSKNNEVYLLLIVRKDKKGASFYLNDVSPKVNIINLGLEKGLTVKAFPKVISAIKEIKPDVVNAHLNTIVYLFPLAILFPKIKLFHTLHNPAEKCTGVKGQDVFNRLFYKRMIQPITISQLSHESYVKYYGRENAVLIDNGRSKPNTTTVLSAVTQEIAQYKNSHHDKVFIHVARCHEQKNQTMLIRVFNRLLSEKRQVILLICGLGFDTTELGHELKAMAQEKGIYFLGAKSNIADYLANSDCFILSSHWEGLPISLLEAMAYGLVPITTPAGGIPSVVTNGYDGVISNGMSDESLYDAIVSYLDGNVKIESKNIVATFEEKYSMTKCANLYLDLYKKKMQE